MYGACGRNGTGDYNSGAAVIMGVRVASDSILRPSRIDNIGSDLMGRCAVPVYNIMV